MEYHPIIDANMHIVERQKKSTAENLRDPEVDFETTVTFFQIGGQVLCLFYSEQPDIRDVFEKTTSVKSYAYFDNGDRPMGVSKKEWEERRQAWQDTGILGEATPAEAGLTSTIVGPRSLCFPTAKEIVPHVRSLNERVKRIAKADALAAKFSQLHAAAAYQAGIVSHTESFMEALSWSKSPEGIAEVAKIGAQVQPKLKEFLTEKDLTEKYKPNAPETK